ncbi:MAG: hypothetical protein HQM08_30340 [Candidatus Riflebacteria bacterium]|nr:hypothetical protein [Candidatus Riflebacteria bacterium]
MYLWHEILHSYITGSRATEFLNHALVKLITDNELREKLNNLSQAYPPFEGHSYLIPLETRILPYWNDYLKNPKKGILEFRRMLIEEKKLDLEDKTEKKE